MSFKIVIAFALVAAVSAAVPYYKDLEYDAPAQYDFNYAVHDDHTGDVKDQQESRHGDALHGSYSLIDADGYKRTVEYTADDHHGFNAVVHREPVNYKSQVPVAKYVAAAPVHYAAPVQYAAPAHYAAPVVAPIAKVLTAPLAAGYAHSGYDAHAHVQYSGPAHNYHY